ncbi:MAG: metal-sulfur cluster assembly factor [FCB group bacterium]|nr:metal-sulfur cluster assembly factor [FCB group bacterium]
MLTEENVKEALSKVIDPEIGMDIVSLGFIYNVKIDEDKIDVDMTLTTRGCPMHQLLSKQAEDAVKNLDGVTDTEINLVWDPPWTPKMMSPAAKDKLGFSDDMIED